MKRIPIILTVILLLALTGCSDYDMYQFVKSQQDAGRFADTPAFDSANDTITIASFNIQVFGTTKAGKPEVMSILAKIISQFDIVAIQEIRDSSGTAIKDLEAAVDALGTDYDYIIGPRLGRTSSKEQYAYMFRTGTVEPLNSRTFEDPADVFHREPLIAEFKAKNGKFDFTIVNIHVDPDEADDEIDALGSLMSILQEDQTERDFIALGDMNSDCAYFQETTGWELSWTDPYNDASLYLWLIDNGKDTTVGSNTCTYDRIIITKATTGADWTGQAGVYRFDEIYGLAPDQAKKVSDHYPVWATFHTTRDSD